MSKRLWLNRDLLRGPYLAMCLTQPQYKAAMAHMRIENPPSMFGTEHCHASTHVLVNPDGDLACVVTLRPTAGRSGTEVAGLLVHEAVHVWQAWCKHVGEDEPGDETEAYAIQWISQQLMDAYINLTKEKP